VICVSVCSRFEAHTLLKRERFIAQASWSLLHINTHLPLHFDLFFRLYLTLNAKTKHELSHASFSPLPFVSPSLHFSSIVVLLFSFAHSLILSFAARSALRSALKTHRPVLIQPCNFEIREEGENKTPTSSFTFAFSSSYLLFFVLLSFLSLSLSAFAG
jgi:hypothetical protein